MRRTCLIRRSGYGNPAVSQKFGNSGQEQALEPSLSVNLLQHPNNNQIDFEDTARRIIFVYYNSHHRRSL